MTDADIAVIGGSGFHSFLDDAEERVVETPYGEPSAQVALGTVAGRWVAFLPRHGRGHQYPPHLINYRANAWALRSLGVRQVLAPCARRNQSFVEAGARPVPFADPYCGPMAEAVTSVADDVTLGGAMVVVEGPRFSIPALSPSTTPRRAGR
jgi:5'-methylthioadenosine phosphorylase